MSRPVAPTIVVGSKPFNASTVKTLAALKPREYGDSIWKFSKDKYPTASIVQKVATKSVGSSVFSRFDQQELPYHATEDVLAAAGDATITFTNHYTRFTLYDVWVNTRTREAVRVNSTVAAAMPVTRGWGDTVAQACLANDVWVKSVPNFPESSTAPAALSTLEEQHTFYCACFEHSAELTWRMAKTRMEIEPDTRKRLIEQAGEIHTGCLKRSYILGGMGATTAATGETTGVKGLLEHIQTNTWKPQNGGLTRPDLFGWAAEQVGPWCPEKNMIFATSAMVINIINQWVFDKMVVNADSPVKQWGVDVDSLLLMGGRKVALVEESWLNDSPETQGWGFLIPAPGTRTGSRWRTFDGNGLTGSTKLYRNVKTEDLNTTFKDVWLTDGGWDHGPERAYGFIYGIQY